MGKKALKKKVMQGLDIFLLLNWHIYAHFLKTCRQLNIPVSAYLHFFSVCRAGRRQQYFFFGSADFWLKSLCNFSKLLDFFWQHWLRLAKFDPSGSKIRIFGAVRDLPWWMFLDLRSRIKVENVAVYWAERPLTDCRVRHRNVYGSFGRTGCRARLAPGSVRLKAGDQASILSPSCMQAPCSLQLEPTQWSCWWCCCVL